MHADLRLAGSLPPLDAPHHMRATEWAMYREGVVVRSVPGEGSLLNVGLDKVGCLFVGHCTVCHSSPKILTCMPAAFTAVCMQMCVS